MRQVMMNLCRILENQYNDLGRILADEPASITTFDCSFKDTVPLSVWIDQKSFEQIVVLTVNMVLRTVPRVTNMHFEIKTIR